MLLTGCDDSAKSVSEEVKKVAVTLEISRFDEEFNRLTPEGLPGLKAKYPYLFPEQFPDSIWIAKHQDSLQIQLRREVASAFQDFSPFEAQLELLYKHVLFYFPQVKLPRIVTLTTDVDYDNRVLLTDSLLFIGLDNYLGQDHEFYEGLSRYLAKGLDSKFMLRDVAESFAVRLVPYPKERSFIARMVYYGKILYLIDLFMPLEPEALKLGYSELEYEWTQANEEQIWRYFVERELLFSTDRELDPRFLDPAPFSKFRLELDSESPGQVGRFIGWKIVQSYTANHSDELNQVLHLSGEQLFQLSQYKPLK